MSERQEHKKRQTLQLEYIAAFSRWLAQEPPFWAVIRRKRWKAARPVYRHDNWMPLPQPPTDSNQLVTILNQVQEEEK